MIITVTMKNVTKQGDIYYFRISVPADCRDAVGKKEITQSRKTKDPAEAKKLAEPLTAKWKKSFQEIRNGSSEETTVAKNKADDTVADFKKQLDDHMQQHLGDYLDSLTEYDLIDESRLCMECIHKVRNDDGRTVDLTHLLGLSLPLGNHYSPGVRRKLRKAVIDALTHVDKKIGEEADWESGKAKRELLEHMRNLKPGSQQPISPLPAKEQPVNEPQDKPEHDIIEVMNLMLDAKNLSGKYRSVVESEIKCLQEWLKNKRPDRPDQIIVFV